MCQSSFEIDKLKSRAPGGANHPAEARGMILVGLILTMVAFSTLGAALVSITSTSYMSQAGANYSQRATYLAEAGHRWLGSRFITANETQRDDTIRDMHEQTFVLADAQGSFKLETYPYFYRTKAQTSPPGNQLATEILGGFPPDRAIPSSGKISVAGAISDYTSFTRAGAEVVFVKTGAWPAISAGTTVLPVAVSSGAAQTFSRGGIIVLGSGADAFPPLRGTFRIDGNMMVYSYRKRIGNELRFITLLQNPQAEFSNPVSVNANTNITLLKYLERHSTGALGSGLMETKRKIIYRGPIAATVDDQASGLFENVTDLINWQMKPPGSSWGNFAIDNTEQALKVTAVQSSADAARAVIGHSDFLRDAWLAQNQFLSYLAQVKVKSTTGYFLAGMSFRLPSTADANMEGFNLSFVRSSDNTKSSGDGIPNNLANTVNDFYITLWEDTPLGQQKKLLAYKKLSASSGVLDARLFTDDMQACLPAPVSPENACANWSVPKTTKWVLLNVGGNRYWRQADNTPADAKNILTLKGVVNLAPTSPATLSFEHYLKIRSSATNFGRAYVEISTNNGSTWSTLASYDQDEILEPWTRKEIVINPPSPFLTDNVKIRFRIDPRFSGNDERVWHIDNVSFGASNPFAAWSTLLARIDEKILTAQDAPTAKFPVNTRVNDIRVYYGSHADNGSGNNVATDDNRLGNPREQVYWPPFGATTPQSDRFTLVQWDVVVADPATEAREANTLLRTNRYLTTTYSADRPELGLHAYGGSVSNNVFFDDLAVALTNPGNKDAIGMLPTVQQ